MTIVYSKIFQLKIQLACEKGTVYERSCDPNAARNDNVVNQDKHYILKGSHGDYKAFSRGEMLQHF